MVTTRVLFADVLDVAKHVQLGEHIPFESRSTTTSAATEPTQGQAGWDDEGDAPRPTNSASTPTKGAQKCGGGTSQFID